MTATRPDWRRKFATWRGVTAEFMRAVPTADFGAELAPSMAEQLRHTMQAERADWEKAEPFTMRVVDNVIHGGVVVLAETRALLLRIPNPFPADFDEFLFPRWTRLRRRLGRSA